MNIKCEEVFHKLESIIGKDSLEEGLAILSTYYDIYSLYDSYSNEGIIEFFIHQIVPGKEVN